MKKIVLLIMTVIAMNSWASILNEEKDWSFMQSVGGIAIDNPIMSTDGWLLPVTCNVSGLNAITIKPTTLNSALVYAGSEISIKKQNIYITIKTGLTKISGKNVSCQPIQLGKIQPNTYKVYYLDPNNTKTYIRDIHVGF